ncbi:MAG: carbon storage regulator CsrA [Planctomyces sp.]|nr:carbon storage regulator CsrA [Planctomyces sp.]
MLVLSRKVGETIQISDNISVTVTEVRGGRVRLSINAPKSVRIVRQEILLDEPMTPTAVGSVNETPRSSAK